MRAGRKPGVSRYADHPIVKYVRSLPEELYLPREVAEQLGCSQAMLDYLVRTSSEPMGATHQAQYGQVKLYLYTPARIEKIRAYRAQLTADHPGPHRRGPAALWTATEARNRRRDFYRARDCRRRAEQYRAAGDEKQAARMDRMEAALRDRLDKMKAKRWAKVHGTTK